MQQKSYDVIIIGAGLGGLTAALKLARSGKKILVIEQHNKVGGFATKFTRKNFTFDVSLHNTGAIFENRVMKHIIDELGISSKMEYIPYDIYQRIIFPEHDYCIGRGIDNFSHYLKEQFPEEKNGIDAVFSIMQEIYEEYTDVSNLDLIEGRLEEIYPMLPIKYPLMVSKADKSFGSILDEHIKNQKLKGLIGNNWWFCGLPLDDLASLIQSVVSMIYFGSAGGFIKGTSQVLSNAIAETIREHNGTIHLNERVIKILSDDSQVQGVITDKGTYYASNIITNINPITTFSSLMDDGKKQRKGVRKFSHYGQSLSAIQLYLGLDCNPTELGMKEHSILISQTYDSKESYNWIVDGNYDKTFIALTNYSAFDKNLAPAGKGVLNIFSLDHIKNWDNLTPEEYRQKKEWVTKNMVQKAEKIMPELSNHIEVQELGTPLTMKKYTLHPEGAIYGFSQQVEQSGMNRPKPDSPMKGLYLAGAYTYPGAGYSSVITSGYKASKEILKSETNQ